MKFKTTAKAIRQSGGKIISINYCGATHLLRHHSPIAYTCGVYGWNFDVYTINGVTICTGYRGMPGKSVDYRILDKYEKAARAIEEEWGKRTYEEEKEAVEALLNAFLEEV